jgi:MoxR-like ATPase
LLLVGPPGTAKSDLVVKFRDALGIDAGDSFEYLLTRFTEPSEILGPIDIGALREGRYLRREQGKLPTAKLVFLDEIFQSNSAILNALLTVINERKFYQDGKPVPVALKVLFAATNMIPEHEELAALRDRFVLKIPCRSIDESQFDALIEKGLRGEFYRDLRQRPWAEGHASLTDIQIAHRYLTLSMATSDAGVTNNDASDKFFPEPVKREFQRIIRVLHHEDGITVSDRKIVKLYRLIRTHAWLQRGGVVERDDLRLLAYVGDSVDQLDRLDAKIGTLVGLPK